MCSSVWSRLSAVFSLKFICYLYPLLHDNTLKQTFYSKVFFEKWNGNEKPKKNLRKESWERTSGTTKWDKLEGGLQILVGQLGQGGGGLQIFVGQVGQGQGVCPLEPFHLSQMGLQGHERFQMFITTPIGATSTNFVVKRDLQNFDSTCGSLWKSFWRHDMKNTRPHLKGFKGTSSGTKVHHPALSFFQNSNRISAEISGFDMNCFFCSSRFLVISHQFRLVWVYSNFPAAARVHIFVPGEKKL